MIRRIGAILAIALVAVLSLAAASSSRWQHVPPSNHAQANPLAGRPEAVAAGALVAWISGTTSTGTVRVSVGTAG